MNNTSAILTTTNKKISGTIHLPSSKSESNRALIMQTLSDGKIKIQNLSEANDTLTLQRILSSKEYIIDVGPAGTTMRFLTALATLQPAERIITGSERMKQRPIAILVNALKQLGAQIEYLESTGYPPLKIRGPLQQLSNKITIQGNISSQYVSALLLIAPSLPLGLELTIENVTSKPYIDMTLAMLKQCGIQYNADHQFISIPHQSFQECTITIEADWSAASYWYALAALADEAELFLSGLRQSSLQGDKKIMEIMRLFGVYSQFKDDGVLLKKELKVNQIEQKVFDLKDCPDLAQTIIVCCAALGHEATFTGLETLRIKETDRIIALQTEVAKLGVKLIEENQAYRLDCQTLYFPQKIYFKTYHDHRMAMAFAPLALKIKEVEIENSAVVAKSYPHFWEDFANV